MFHRYHLHHSSQAELIARARRNEQAKKKIALKIDEQMAELKEWIVDNGNKSKIYYEQVENIGKYFILENIIGQNDEITVKSLELLRNRLCDLNAINTAIRGGSVSDLTERAMACKENRSEGLQGLGMLIGVLAATLVLIGLCAFTPSAIIFGAMIGLVAYLVFDVGAKKVNTDQSRLFKNLKESIAPSPSTAAAPYQELNPLPGLDGVPLEYTLLLR